MRSAATLTVAYLLLILQSTVLELAPVPSWQELQFRR